jgi:DNA-binding Lrp family transcriptional regulator
MVIGVTMVKVVPGQEKAVYNALQEIDGIKDVYHVFGEFDFVVIIEVEGLSMLNKLVDVIREIDNVNATQTVVGAEL